MAVLSATSGTLLDFAKRLGDDYKIGRIIELLSQTNEILEDITFVEGNLPTGLKTTVRTGLPQGTWRRLNQGIQPTKSTTAQITATCGNLEGYAEVDKDLADLNNNTAAWRASESMAFIEGMNQQIAQAVFYSNERTSSAQFTGLAAYYPSVSTGTSATAANVIDAGGTGSNNTSIWMVVWGPNTVTGFFPMGKLTGLQHRDLGEQTIYDASMGRYQAYRDHFKWEIGIAVRDWRYVVRICNIDITLLSGGSAANIINLLIRGFNRLPTTGTGKVTTSDANGIRGAMGSTRIYVNRTINTYLELQVVNKANVLLQMVQWQGMVIPAFRGIPIKVCDQILNTEARVV
jgi:hypothetical protein